MKLQILIILFAAVAAAAVLLLVWSIPWAEAIVLGALISCAVFGLLDWCFECINIFVPLRDRIVADWRQAWRWVSVQMLALAGILQVLGLALEKAWLAVPPGLLGSMSPSTIQVISLVVCLLGIAGRLVKQPKTTEGQ